MQSVRSLLQQILSEQDAQKAIQENSYQGMAAEQRSKIAEKFQVYEGKVRELVRTPEFLYVLHTDRLTAFDRLVGLVPYKGIILCEISRIWLEWVSKIVPTHFISAIDARTLKVRPMEPIKVEVVVRGYLAGSMMRAYQEGERTFCGVSLPNGLQPYQKLAKPILTPTTKAAAFEHDEATSPDELVHRGVCSAGEWHKISEMALKVFAFGQEIFAQKGWILVDTKYEFGRDRDGQIVLIDEVHTPDSSRLWQLSSYEQRLANQQAPEMLDKEVIRRYLMAHGFKGEGEVPQVPAERLIDLALVYLRVAEALKEDELHIDSARPDYSRIQ